MTENSNDIYIGSTILSLKLRLQIHESRYRNGIYCSSQEIIKQGKYKIVLIENFACATKAELEFEETRFQKDMVCVNKKLARLTKDDIRENQKQYRIENKNKIRENQKQYNKQYYINNKDDIRKNQKQYVKQYYIENKQKLNQKFTCACGGRYLYRTKSMHYKSIKHINYLKSKTKYIFKIKRN
jgi:hypothetical protein